MTIPRMPDSLSDSLGMLAGYLNFSSGFGADSLGKTHPVDRGTMAAWNDVYAEATAGDPLSGMPAWLVVQDWIEQTLDQRSKENNAFADCRQARRAIELLWSKLLPEYLDFHRDLLFHQEPEQIVNGFFLGNAADAILSLIGQSESESVSDHDLIQVAIDRLDDYVGYRPVAMLENRNCHPYRHEFICPVPLYIQGIGCSAGLYQEIISMAVEVLRNTEPSILRSASFELDRMVTLSLDPRAYDFDHPVNRRPNYHFGGWDEGAIDLDGFYHRFIVRAVTLDALLHWIKENQEDYDPKEIMVESATVLAGTILMASGISGWGPGAYSSDITLGSLMKPIASYRDDFYADRLAAIQGEHGDRLRAESKRRHQPFGAIRQHLNTVLAKQRAGQLQHVQLARLYARMGYPEAAKRQTDTVPAASARLICRIDCLMTQGLRRLREGKLCEAAEVPETAFDLIKRAIECGALIDPWEILGSAGAFALYPGPESSVHDPRVDDILYLVEQVFGYVARVWSEAAAQDHQAIYQRMETFYDELAQWWRQYAAHTVESIEAADPLESFESAKLVARALQLWHRGGAEAGNVAFWAPHADLFDSPRAYALVISALLEREDFVPAMALLVHWLSNADRVGLRLGASSLPRLSERWLVRLRGSTEHHPKFGEPSIDQVRTSDTRDVWPLARKFFDYLEANAEEFWSAPGFQIGSTRSNKRDWEQELTHVDDDPSLDEDAGLYDAAYEGMTYRDTTDDDNDGAIFDPESEYEQSQDELESESKRLTDHLSFLQSLARMWAVAADMAVTDRNGEDLAERIETLKSWSKRAKENRIGLLELLDDVRSYRVAAAGSDKDSMRGYDRQRVLRDSLMERIIHTAVEMSDARRLVCGALVALQVNGDHSECPGTEELPEEDACAVRLFASLIANDIDQARQQFPVFLEDVREKSLLYLPISRGGDPVKIYVARLRQRVLRHLMHWLPRRGMLAETCRLIDVAREMEHYNPIGMGAVTEFDGLYHAGFRSLVACVVESTKHALSNEDSSSHDELSTAAATDRVDELRIGEPLIEMIERLTEIMLASWLAHSQTLRLSPLETVNDPRKWNQLVEFIKTYGDPIFTQTFLQLGNVRAILHQGVGNWIERAMEQQNEHFIQTKLFEDLESEELRLSQAERWMTLVYEALMDHHTEYLDYNSTTTQSDRGNLVYTFFDFLRLRVRYERIAWNLRPVMWAHEVLVRSRLERCAVMWRRSLSERIGSEAEIYVQQLRKLQKTHAMQMPTVADRIEERFIQPMTIDRIRALVGPAMRAAEAGEKSNAFELLEQEANLLTQNPTGVGLDVPAWIEALEEEVEQLGKRRIGSEIDPQLLMTIPITPLSMKELSEQLDIAKTHGRRLPHMKEEDEPSGES